MRDSIPALCALMAELGLAFAAFGIWLTVRIVNRQERWAKQLAVALVVFLAGYMLSFGPIARLEYRGDLPRSLVLVFKTVYLPVGLALNFGPQWIRSPIIWYLHAWGAW